MCSFSLSQSGDSQGYQVSEASQSLRNITEMAGLSRTVANCRPAAPRTPKGVSSSSFYILIECKMWSFTVVVQKLLSTKAFHWPRALSVDQGVRAWPEWSINPEVSVAFRVGSRREFVCHTYKWYKLLITPYFSDFGKKDYVFPPPCRCCLFTTPLNYSLSILTISYLKCKQRESLMLLILKPRDASPRP